jgi:hypothetical protein
VRYPDEDFDSYQDRVTDEAIQREVDDMQDKRNACQISPEILSLQEARIDGQRAGHLGLSASLNPYQDGCPEHDIWESSRSLVIGAYLANLKRVA